MPRIFSLTLQAEHRYEVEYFLPKTGHHRIITNARYVVSKQQEHLVGYDGKTRRSLGVGTIVLKVSVLLPVRTPVAS